MKLFIASDIHGSAHFLKILLERYAETNADKFIILGDILYHGPRNDLPLGYAPKEVIALLNPLAGEIIAVRGNCEAEVDQMVLAFPCMASYAPLLLEDGRLLFATHGHEFNEEKLPPMPKGSVLLHGHTHVKTLSDKGDYYLLNPGSASIPKDGSHSYMAYENGVFETKDLLTGETLGRLELTPLAK